MATVFTPHKLDTNDGSTTYQVQAPAGECIASCTSQYVAAALATALNIACAHWREQAGGDPMLNEVRQ